MTYFKNLNDPLFNNFQILLVATVNSNAVAWDIPLPVAGELLAKKTAYDPLYAAIVNKNTRTHEELQDYREFRETYEKFIEDFANEYIISNSAISESQKNTLGFNVRKDTHGTRPPITADVYGKLEALSSSKIQFQCRTDNSDNRRPSVYPDADGVEVRYIIANEPPATVDDCTEKEISTKARFTLQMDPTDAGKRIYAYMRWRNNSNVEKSGPWTDILSTVVRS